MSNRVKKWLHCFRYRENWLHCFRGSEIDFFQQQNKLLNEYKYQKTK